MIDSDALADLIAELIGEHVERATAPLLARLSALEAREDPAPGLDATAVRTLVSEAIAGVPRPPSVASEEVERMVADAVAALPPARDGTSVTVDDVRPMVEAEVVRAASAVPPPKDGVGVAGAVIDRDGGLVLTLSDGTVRELGRVVGTDADMAEIERFIAEKVAAIPRPRDGFSLEHFDTEWDGERTLTLSFSDGRSEYSHQLHMPIVIDRGVWKEGSYQQGDGVTWAGSWWIAQRDTDAKPDAPDSGWRLAVKRGRDGKDKA